MVTVRPLIQWHGSASGPRNWWLIHIFGVEVKPIYITLIIYIIHKVGVKSFGVHPNSEFLFGSDNLIFWLQSHICHMVLFVAFFSTTTTECKVYFFDPRQFQQTKFGTLKTGAFRALFLLQSVRVLKRRLRAIGCLAWKHIENCSRELLFSFWYLLRTILRRIKPHVSIFQWSLVDGVPWSCSLEWPR